MFHQIDPSSSQKKLNSERPGQGQTAMLNPKAGFSASKTWVTGNSNCPHRRERISYDFNSSGFFSACPEFKRKTSPRILKVLLVDALYESNKLRFRWRKLRYLHSQKSRKLLQNISQAHVELSTIPERKMGYLFRLGMRSCRQKHLYWCSSVQEIKS